MVMVMVMDMFIGIKNVLENMFYDRFVGEMILVMFRNSVV